MTTSERVLPMAPLASDRGLRALSRAADHGVLWFGISAALFAIGGRPRRAAVRGLLSLGGASALTNAVLKPILPRRRPPVGWVAEHRQARRVPTSSSFPSGHSASAAAYVTGVALESPATAALLAPVAAAVAYSRVHIGVHWPSDVVVGAAVGGGIALSTRRWWAVRTEEPATLGPTVAAPEMPNGAGLLVLVNPGSGTADDDPAAELSELLPEATLVEADPDTDLETQLDDAIARVRPRALGVCGGDGTVVAAAAAAIRNDLVFAVFPGGTLNHFARDTGVEDIEATREAVAEGRATRLDVAEVSADGQDPMMFVNTASLGGYPDAVRLRERWEHRVGKWPAAAAAMVRVLAQAQPLEVSMDGRRIAVWMLFVGNGRYSPSDQVPMSRPELHNGLLDVRSLRADRPWSRTRLLWAAATGTLGGSAEYERTMVADLDVRVHGEAISLATDGEVVGKGNRFRFTSRPLALRLYR
ncbi:diacylglycerol kinase family enzyme/membrane-associated phospholipid phosphatase [Rhodococcus sp. PvR044]|uniref:bifunctional phosphatase PAP2/diacylglycerol kinase family protein n=1 Tax=Rhodococcus TaxID=1827 RepID=UPI000BD28294|nr:MULTISPECIES: bifunctional phosphatase PAP2/diacylglycerol kinase family protein [Rhodococcus]MCZ4558988.1 phosphatase PAP2 family protein [Rhodococcus maanshanensis]PTR45388.1 undecaprenyl-diphosphatase [Rhodococcus sp. OK611]SNX88938.1 undecaprenyl-diphosphatase [Rhodococcus sp. OK270]